MKNDDIEFDNWFDILCGILKRKGYSMLPDSDTAREDYDKDYSPEESAVYFEKEWGDPCEEEID